MTDPIKYAPITVGPGGKPVTPTDLAVQEPDDSDASYTDKPPAPTQRDLYDRRQTASPANDVRLNMTGSRLIPDEVAAQLMPWHKAGLTERGPMNISPQFDISLQTPMFRPDVRAIYKMAGVPVYTGDKLLPERYFDHNIPWAIKDDRGRVIQAANQFEFSKLLMRTIRDGGALIDDPDMPEPTQNYKPEEIYQSLDQGDFATARHMMYHNYEAGNITWQEYMAFAGRKAGLGELVRQNPDLGLVNNKPSSANKKYISAFEYNQWANDFVKKITPTHADFDDLHGDQVKLTDYLWDVIDYKYELFTKKHADDIEKYGFEAAKEMSELNDEGYFPVIPDNYMDWSEIPNEFLIKDAKGKIIVPPDIPRNPIALKGKMDKARADHEEYLNKQLPEGYTAHVEEGNAYDDTYQIQIMVGGKIIGDEGNPVTPEMLKFNGGQLDGYRKWAIMNPKDHLEMFSRVAKTSRPLAKRLIEELYPDYTDDQKESVLDGLEALTQSPEDKATKNLKGIKAAVKAGDRSALLEFMTTPGIYGLGQSSEVRTIPPLRELVKMNPAQKEKALESMSPLSRDLLSGIGGMGSSIAGIGMRSRGGKWAKEMYQGSEELAALANPMGENMLLNVMHQSAQSLPFMVAMIPLAMLGAWPMAALGTALKASPFVLALMEATGSTVLSRPFESASEAGSAWIEASEKLDRNGKRVFTDAQCDEIFDQVFKGNLVLGALDVTQFLATSIKVPWLKTMFKTANPKLINVGKTLGAVGYNVLTEGGEEVYQQIIQDMAMGREIKWDADMLMVFMVGGFMGATMGGVMDAYSRVTDKAYAKLPPEVQAEVQADIAGQQPPSAAPAGPPPVSETEPPPPAAQAPAEQAPPAAGTQSVFANQAAKDKAIADAKASYEAHQAKVKALNNALQNHPEQAPVVAEAVAEVAQEQTDKEIAASKERQAAAANQAQTDKEIADLAAAGVPYVNPESVVVPVQPVGREEPAKPLGKAEDTVEIQNLLTKYQDGDTQIATVSDIVDALEAMDISDPDIQKAIDDFRAAQQENREVWGERGGMDNEETAVTAAITNYLENNMPKGAPAQAVDYSKPIKSVRGSDNVAYGSDGTTEYKFEYQVMEAADLLISHDPDTFEPIPEYPKDWQERHRDNTESRTQIAVQAAKLNQLAPAYTSPNSSTLVGTPLATRNGTIIAGNGRLLEILTAIKKYPANYQIYREMILKRAAEYGLDVDGIKNMANPVLVRVSKLTEAKELQFLAEDSNTPPQAGSNEAEKADRDAKRMTDDQILRLHTSDSVSIDTSLQGEANAEFMKEMMEGIPRQERSAYANEGGGYKKSFIKRVKEAILAYVYAGENGKELVKALNDSEADDIKAAAAAIYQTVPKVGQAEILVKSGARDVNLTFADDMAAAVVRLASIRQTGLTLKKFLQQGRFEMGAKPLTPRQEKIMFFLDEARGQSTIADFLNSVADQIIGSPDIRQESMWERPPVPTIDEVINNGIRTAETNKAARNAKGGNKDTAAAAQGNLMEKSDKPAGAAGVAAEVRPTESQTGPGTTETNAGGEQSGGEGAVGKPGESVVKPPINLSVLRNGDLVTDENGDVFKVIKEDNGAGVTELLKASTKVVTKHVSTGPHEFQLLARSEKNATGAAPKELWQMTFAEFSKELSADLTAKHKENNPATWGDFLNKIGYRPEDKDMGFRRWREIVQDAQKQGLDVPQTVLDNLADPKAAQNVIYPPEAPEKPKRAAKAKSDQLAGKITEEQAKIDAAKKKARDAFDAAKKSHKDLLGTAGAYTKEDIALLDSLIELASHYVNQAGMTVEKMALDVGLDVSDFMREAWERAKVMSPPPEKVKEPAYQGTAPLRGPQPASNLAESEKKTVKNKSKTYDDLVANLRSMADAKSLLYDPSYHPMNIEEDAQRAIDFVAKYPNEADMVNSGLRFAPAEITEVAIRRASVAMAIATKNDVKLSRYINGLLNTNRLFGRNIVANKGVAIGGNMLNWTGAVQEANVEKWERDHNKGIRKEENKTSYQKFSQEKVADIKDGMQVNVRKRAVKSAEVAAWLKQYMC